MSKYVTITDYTTGEPLAEMLINNAVWQEYMQVAQQPEGLIELADLGSILYAGTPAELDSLPASTVVFLAT